MTSMPIEPPPDDRGERMVADPRRYFDEARERAAGRGPEPTVRPAGRARWKKYSKPVPGVVQVQATGCSDDDIQRLVERMRADGYRIYLANPRLYEHQGGTVCRYYSVAVEEDGE